MKGFFSQELLLATHLGISAVMTSLVSHRCSNLARILYKRILSGSTYQVNTVILCQDNL